MPPKAPKDDKVRFTELIGILWRCTRVNADVRPSGWRIRTSRRKFNSRSVWSSSSKLLSERTRSRYVHIVLTAWIKCWSRLFSLALLPTIDHSTFPHILIWLEW